MATTESITDEIVLHTVQNLSRDNQNYDESDDKNDCTSHAKPLFHGRVVDVCAKIPLLY